MDFVKNIYTNGGEVYIVGGAVRTYLFNHIHKKDIRVKDYDLIVRNIPNLDTLLNKFGRIDMVGHSFGVIKFRPNNCDFILDITYPRTEKSTGPGYKDFKIICDHKMKLLDDLKRRDATINAIAVKINSEDEIFKNQYDMKNLYDPFDGTSDIRNRIWKAVGDPDLRFYEDPTRIMRALRQCAELDFKLDELTRISIVKNKHLLTTVIKSAPVRLTEELIKLFMTNNNYMVKFLFSSGISDIFDIPSESIVYLLNNTYNLRIKIACMLIAHKNKHIGQWLQKYQLSAAPSFPKYDIKFILSICGIKFDSDALTIKKLIQQIGYEYALDVVKYYEIMNNTTYNDVTKICQEYKNIIMSENDVKLRGDTITKLYGLRGIEIGKMKRYLFDEITLGNVRNEEAELIEYIRIKKVEI